MDPIETERELREVAEHQRELCRRYAEEREAYGKAAWAVMLLLVPKQQFDYYKKASFEKQLLMVLAETPEHHKEEVYGLVKQMKIRREIYHGLEKMIDQAAARISSIQSLMRWQRSND